MADEEATVGMSMGSPVEELNETIEQLNTKMKGLESELEQHKKLFNIHRAALQPYLDSIVKEIVSKLHITYKEK